MNEEFEDEMYETYYAQQAAEEEAYWQNMKALACQCPVCDGFSAEPDFEPDDPSVGIFHWCFTNQCDECGVVFYTYDDATQEVEADV